MGITGGRTDRIKVLHLITDLDPGGAEMMLYKLLSRSDREHFDQRVVSLTDVGVIGRKIENLGLPAAGLGLRLGGLPSLAALRHLSAILRRTGPDILVAWMYHAALLGTLVRPRTGKLKILWNLRCAEMDFSRYRRLTSWVVRACAWCSSRPQVVIANSEEGLRVHQRLGFHPKRWAVIPNGFDLQQFRIDPESGQEVRAKLGLKGDSLLIGLVARFDPMKDHATFLAAASRLAQKNPRVIFILAGPGVTGENPFFQPYLRRADLSRRLLLLGFREDIPRLTAALDLATSSSFGEGFPNAVGEAMACGVPCVVTAVGDSAYLVGETGRVVPPRDPEALLRAWEELLALPEANRRKLGLQARRRMEACFDLGRVALEFEDLFREVAGLNELSN